MTETTETRIETGIGGLDDVLHGGLIPGRSYVVAGRPGTGKSLVALQYLATGAAAGEDCLYVNLEETTEDIRANAAAAGISVDGIDFLDRSPSSDVFADSRQYDVFAPDEVEGPDVAEAIADRIEADSPDRVVVDPITQLRTLSPDAYQFRKHVASFAQLLAEHDATVAFTSQATADEPDDDLQFISDGTIELDRTARGRTLTVPKFRGSAVEPGEHAMRITDEGVLVHPKLTPDAHGAPFTAESISAGVPEIDQILHGGLERGTVTILSGPTGVGKTTLGTQFMKEAAGRGERSVIYMFEESTETLLSRSKSVNIPAQAMLDRGTLAVEEVEPLEKSSAEFASMVREEVEQHDTSIVMIDGIDGYRLSLQGEEGDLERELNSLGRYLKRMGVTVIFVDSVDAVVGEFRPTNGGVSYLADNIVFLRYLEMQGELRKAIGVLKMRTSDFERSLREFAITEHGISVGDSLTGLRGILSGSPEFTRDRSQAGSVESS